MADPTRIKITALDATRNAFRSVTRGLKGITGAVFSLKTGLVGLAGIGGFGLLIKSSLQSIDTLGKTASKLGVTTKELGALRFAAEISGVEIRTVDMATQRFTRRLAEAANGTGEAKDALKELNINASEISKLPLQEQMLRLSDAFANVESSSEKVRLAFKLFDSEGVAFVNILKLGSDELSKLFKEADDLGILLSGSAVQGVEKANDAILKLSKLFKGITDQTFAALAPALEHLATVLKDDILDSIKGSNESVSAFGRTLAGEFLESIKQVIIGFQTFFNGMIKIINRVGELAVFGKRMFKSFEAIKQINIDFKIMDELIRKVGTAQKEVETETNNTNKSLSTMDQIFKGLKGGLDDYVKGVNTLDLSLKDITSKGLKSFEDSLLSIFDKTKTVKEAVQRGRPYMVGERGAELFVPSRSGSIVPNNQLQGGGGVVINQTINVTTGVQQTVRTEIANLMPRIAQASKQAVLESRQRGGSFATAFGG